MVREREDEYDEDEENHNMMGADEEEHVEAQSYSQIVQNLFNESMKKPVNKI